MQICIPFIFNTCLAEPVFALFRKHYKSRLAGLERAIWSGSTVLSSQIEKKKDTTPKLSTTEMLQVLFLFDLILYVVSTIFQFNTDGSSWVEPAIS